MNPSARSHLKGFTLVELLVSIAITAVLLTALGVITSNTQSAIKYHKGNMNTDSTAWEVFNVVEQDLKNRVIMNAAQFHLGDRPEGDDALAFYTNRYGIKSTKGDSRIEVGERKASWVHYKLEGTALKRGSIGLDLSPEDFVSVLASKNPNRAEAPQKIDNQYYQTLSQNLLRMEMVAIVKEVPLDAESPTRFRYVANPDTSEDEKVRSRTIEGIAITLVTVDDKLLQLVKNPETIQTIKTLFPAAKPSSEETLSGSWSKIAEQVSALPESIPLPVRQNMQVFERVIWF